MVYKHTVDHYKTSKTVRLNHDEIDLILAALDDYRPYDNIEKRLCNKLVTKLRRRFSDVLN